MGKDLFRLDVQFLVLGNDKTTKLIFYAAR